jgi:hypothetical protein
VDDWGRLLSGCGVNSSTQGSNPCLPAIFDQVSSQQVGEDGGAAGGKAARNTTAPRFIEKILDQALVAQRIERLVADQKVAGSNPAEGTWHYLSPSG